MSLRAEITFDSDWRVGTGAGRPAGVDRAVARDHDGLPFVPAKTLVGIWCDAAEQFAAALDDDAPGPWSERVAWLFDGRRIDEERLLTVRPARLPQELIELLGGAEGEPLRRAMVTVRAGVRIDAKGLAVDDHLRFDEVARRGMTLHAPVEIELDGVPEEERRRLLALLQASATFADAIGANRRRGLGRCRVQFAGTGIDSESLVELLEGDAPVPDRQAPPAASPATPAPGLSRAVVLELTLTTQTPLLVDPEVTGNLHMGRTAIRGGNLLPAVCRLLDAVLGPGSGDRAVRLGELTVLDARPEVAGQRGRPVPFCMARFKDGDGFDEDDGVRNAFADPAAAEGEPVRQLKGLRDGFLGVATSTELPPYRRPRRVTRIHNTIDDARQRPIAAEEGGSGGLFVYGALPAGERLGAVVRLHGQIAALVDDEALGEIERCLSRGLRLGRSKRDDYGAVAVAVAVGDGPAPVPPSLGAGDTFSVWLLSDLVPRRGAGVRLGAGALLDALADGLVAGGASTDLLLEHATTPTEEAAVAVRARRIESWQRSWGLPRPSLDALTAGSCALVRVAAGSVPGEALSAVMSAGIGTRTAEGHGEVLLDDPLLSTPLHGKRAAQPEPEPEPEPGAHAAPSVPDGYDEVVLQLEDAAWRDHVRQQAEVRAGQNAAELFEASRPSASQFARVRGATLTVAGARARLLVLLPQEAGDDKRAARWASKGWSTDTIRRLRALARDGAEAGLFERLAPLEHWLAITAASDPERARRLRERHADFALAALVDGVARTLATERVLAAQRADILAAEPARALTTDSTGALRTEGDRALADEEPT